MVLTPTSYDKARPGYPMELLDDVQRFANAKSFKKGLEVGAGTGQATDLFLDKIEKLDIIEVGEKQVGRLRMTEELPLNK